MTPGDFPAVLAAAKRGEPEALEALYRDNSARVLGYLRAQGSPEPEDLTAEVFVSAVRNLERFEGDEASFRSWLFTIAQRRLIDERRRRARRPEDPAPTGVLSGAMAPGDDAESQALEHLRATGVLDALEQLTPDQRDVLYLRVLADLSVPEIARVLGKPETAVKALLRRGLARLQRAVAGAEADTDV